MSFMFPTQAVTASFLLGPPVPLQKTEGEPALVGAMSTELDR